MRGWHCHCCEIGPREYCYASSQAARLERPRFEALAAWRALRVWASGQAGFFDGQQVESASKIKIEALKYALGFAYLRQGFRGRAMHRARRRSLRARLRVARARDATAAGRGG